MKKMKLAMFAGLAGAAALTFAGCSSGGTDETTAVTTERGTETEDTTSETDVAESSSAATEYDLSGVNFNSPDIVLNYGDYDEMTQLANDIRDGNVDDKVVEIEGYHSNTTMHSIMERNAEDTAGVGFDFVVVGFEESDYPNDGARIKIIGVVKDTGEEAFGMKLRTIVVPQENYELIDPVN